MLFYLTGTARDANMGVLNVRAHLTIVVHAAKGSFTSEIDVILAAHQAAQSTRITQHFEHHAEQAVH